MASQSDDLTRQGFAELIGTIFLAATVGVGVVGTGHFSEYNFLFLPVLVGAVVAILIYLFGGISGAHFNPAVTVAMYVFGRLKAVQAVVYVVAQVVGAAIGFQLAEVLIGQQPNVPTAAGSAAVLAEFVGAFLLVAAVSSVVLGVVSEVISGLVVGLALTVGITLALGASGGILNPAVALALGGYHLSYLVAPLLGGVVGAGAIIWLHQKPHRA